MGDPRCHHCGRRRARRCHRVGALERVLSAVYVYPFRCQVCGRRFRALAWGRRYVRRSADHREWERVAIRAPVVLVLVAWLRPFPWSGPCVYGINC